MASLSQSCSNKVAHTLFRMDHNRQTTISCSNRDWSASNHWVLWEVKAAGLPSRFCCVTAASVVGVVVAPSGVLVELTLTGVLAPMLPSSPAGTAYGDCCSCCQVAAWATGAGDVAMIGFSRCWRIIFNSSCSAEHSTDLTLQMFSFPHLTTLSPK